MGVLGSLRGIWWFPKLRVPYQGPHYKGIHYLELGYFVTVHCKGILLVGDLFSGSPILVNPHILNLSERGYMVATTLESRKGSQHNEGQLNYPQGPCTEKGNTWAFKYFLCREYGAQVYSNKVHGP